jgi:hypothetical protein
MKWLKPHPIIGQFRIVRKFPLLPIHTDDGYMVWLETVWVLEEYRFVVDEDIWVPIFTGSSYFACKEHEYKLLMEKR